VTDEQLEVELRARALPGLSDGARSRLLAELDSIDTNNEIRPSPRATKSRGPLLAMCMGVAAVAALVVVVVWIANLESTRTNQQVADRTSADPDQPNILHESRETDEVKNELVDDTSGPTAGPVGSRSKAEVISGSGSSNVVPELHFEDKNEPVIEKVENSTNRKVIDDNPDQPPMPLRRKSLNESVAEATVIVVATALKSAPAPPERPDDAPENLITFQVNKVLKGKLADKVIVTRTPTVAKEFIDKEWVVMLSPEYLAGKHKYAGVYGMTLEPEIREILGELDE